MYRRAVHEHKLSRPQGKSPVAILLVKKEACYGKRDCFY